jgi:signal transduction histidine kinase
VREATRELIALPATAAAPAPSGALATLLAVERSRAERLLNALRLGIVGLLAIAAVAYAPAIPRALRIANVAVLFPMLAWSVWQGVLARRDGGILPAWLSAVSPLVDATAITAIVISYGLLGAPIVALKAPVALVYFVILAARPMTGSPRSAAATTVVIVLEYALILLVLLPVAGGVTADPITAAASGRVSLLDEGMKIALLGACGAISTYATAWHSRVLTRALAGQLARDTEERELAARLQEADKLAALGILAASIAHEVNNPLSAIALSADLLARTASDDATREELVAIANDARRTAGTVRNLLSFARTDSSTRAAITLDEPVDRALGTLRSLLRDRGITVEASLAARGVELHGDAAALERVVINLVINAAQAMEGQARERVVRVATWDDGDRVHLTVEDSGPGFAPGAAERLFERFFTTKPAGKGTGLGLWMVAQVVEMHGGTISATDTGSGARFALAFPRLSDAVAA